MKQTQVINSVTFKSYLFKNKQNQLLLLLAGIASIIEFSIFKYFYPFASYIHGDSFSYLNAAYHNLGINTYPIGYSKFIRLVSVFAKSDTFLVILQYILIQASVLFLSFTIFYLIKPHKVTRYLILLIIVFNPLFLHLANLVSSDNFFLSLSLIWFGLLLWLVYQPSTQVVVWHTIVLFIAFTVRYNALLYPAFATVVFLMSTMSTKRKLLGISASLIICGLFVLYTSNRYKELTGHWQYSPFSGWQMANNAMYAYRFVDSDKRKPVDKKYIALDNMIRNYFDSTRDVSKYPSEGAMASTFYMWSKGMPLMEYRDSLFKKDTTAKELKKWASMGPLYKNYGTLIITKYPWEFIKYFIWPNSIKYYSPPVEFLKVYNGEKDTVPNLVKAWFGYKSGKVYTRMQSKEVWALNYYPIMTGVLNVMMLCCLICYLILKGWKYGELFNKGILLGGMFWLLNAFFTIGASSAALRFQSFPITLTTIFVLLTLDWMIQLVRNTEDEIIANVSKSQWEEEKSKALA